MERAKVLNRLVLLLVLCVGADASRTIVRAEEGALADRIVAVVDEDAILLSDVQQVIGLGLAEAREEESEEELGRRVLDGLIDQKLRFHEIDRFGFSEVPREQVDRAYADFVAGFESDESAAAAIRSVGLDQTSLRRLFARQLMVLTYVDERLGARVFVGADDIQEYYDNVFTPRLREAGQDPPMLGDVREEIRSVIKEERLNREIERWTESLRAEADVVDYWDVEASELPPVVISTEGSSTE